MARSSELSLSSGSGMPLSLVQMDDFDLDLDLEMDFGLEQSFDFDNMGSSGETLPLVCFAVLKGHACRLVVEP